MSIKHCRSIDSCLGAASVALLVLSPVLAKSAAAVEFPGPDPGKATARLADGQLILENATLAATWTTADGKLQLVKLEDRISGQKLSPAASEAFRVLLADGTRLAASQCRFAGEPTLTRIEPEQKALQPSRREAGWDLSACRTGTSERGTLTPGA